MDSLIELRQESKSWEESILGNWVVLFVVYMVIFYYNIIEKQLAGF